MSDNCVYVGSRWFTYFSFKENIDSLLRRNFKAVWQRHLIRAAIHYSSWRKSCRAAQPFRLQMVTNSVVPPLIKSVLIFWGKWLMEPWLFSSNCASVVWGLMHQCSAVDWKREEVLLLIECYRKHPCLWNSTLKYYKSKDRLEWYKNTDIRLRK